MKTERLVGHHEARDALVLSIAGVTAVILIESLVLLIGYWVERLLRQQSRRRYAAMALPSASGNSFCPGTVVTTKQASNSSTVQGGGKRRRGHWLENSEGPQV
jgi:hypothetical protein